MDYALTARKFYEAFKGTGSRKITRILEDGSKGMYCILRIIRDSAGEVLPVDIAKKMDISTARVAVAMKALEKRGFIEKTPSARDGRKIVVKATDAGLRALSGREAVICGLIETFLRKLDADEAQTFVALSEKLFS